MDGYRLGLYEKAMPENLSLEKKLILAKKIGFDYIEISIDETAEKISRLDYSKERRGELHRFMTEQGIFFETMCLSAHRRYPLGSTESKTRKISLDIMKKAIIFARDLGIRVIQLAGYDVYYETGSAKTRSNFAEGLKECVDYASKFGIILAFETMETEFMNTIEKAQKVVKEVNSPYLQIYPDIGNIRNAVQDCREDICKGDGHIVAVHLKETAENVFRDMEYGQGRVDFRGCIRQLRRQGVTRFTCEFWYDKKSDPETYITRNYNYIRGCF